MARESDISISNERRRHAHVALAAVLSGLVALAWLLRSFPPAQYRFYPRCPFNELTGLLCPGCGATRALAALARGNLAEALHWNALVVMLLPVSMAWGAVAYRRAVVGGEVRWSNRATAAGLSLAVVFMVLRNFG